MQDLLTNFKDSALVCPHILECGGCTQDSPYEIQLKGKVQNWKLELWDLIQDNTLQESKLEIFSSPPRYFRSRGEFRIYRHTNGMQDFSLSMNSFGSNSKVPISSCHNLLPKLNKLIALIPKILPVHLSEHLYAINLLGNTNSDCILTFIYIKPLKPDFKIQAKSFLNTLKLKGFLEDASGIVGVSKNQEIIVHTNILSQDFTLNYAKEPTKDPSFTKTLKLLIYAGTFSQPNPFINQKMQQFLITHLLSHKREDLLELYCGNGNFTIPLSEIFTKVLATEVVKKSILIAKRNQILNQKENIKFIRLSGEESRQAIKKERIFFRLKDVNLEEFSFSHILVDPPRSGIKDENILKFMSEFKNILYISCCLKSLKRDLKILLKTHRVDHFAIFDQFPNTNHIESILILKKFY